MYVPTAKIFRSDARFRVRFERQIGRQFSAGHIYSLLPLVRDVFFDGNRGFVEFLTRRRIWMMDCLLEDSAVGILMASE